MKCINKNNRIRRIKGIQKLKTRSYEALQGKKYKMDYRSDARIRNKDNRKLYEYIKQ